MRNPPLMGMPFFSGNDGEAIQLTLWIGQLNAIACSKESVIRHSGILGQILEQSAGMLSLVSESEVLRLSPSRISDYENCPQLYKYRVIDRLPQPPSLDAERGTLVHSVLHELFESPRNERTPVKTAEILPSAWKSQLENKPELQEMITSEKEWLDRAQSLLDTYFNIENPTEFEATHREIHLENDFAQDVYLHGYVDRLDIAPTGEVRIIDYKTGKSPKPGWEEKAFFQLRVYAFLYFRSSGVLPKLLRLIYLGDGRKVERPVNSSDLISVEKTLNRVAADINNSISQENWPAKPSRLCDWCYFKNICPAHVD